MNIHSLIHRCCKIIGMHHYYENKYGIKEHNKQNFEYPREYDIKLVNPKEVYLGFDGLNDKYTLVGTPIEMSPHTELMRLIHDNKDIANSEYVIREKEGYLDGRYGISIPDHISKFHKAKNELMNGIYQPPIIYQINDKVYVFDGKHRLALCYILGLECKCICIDTECLRKDIHTQRLYNEMKKRNNYKKNIELLDKIWIYRPCQ